MYRFTGSCKVSKYRFHVPLTQFPPIAVFQFIKIEEQNQEFDLAVMCIFLNDTEFWVGRSFFSSSRKMLHHFLVESRVSVQKLAIIPMVFPLEVISHFSLAFFKTFSVFVLQKFHVILWMSLDVCCLGFTQLC